MNAGQFEMGCYLLSLELTSECWPIPPQTPVLPSLVVLRAMPMDWQHVSVSFFFGSFLALHRHWVSNEIVLFPFSCIMQPSACLPAVCRGRCGGFIREIRKILLRRRFFCFHFIKSYYRVILGRAAGEVISFPFLFPFALRQPEQRWASFMFSYLFCW
jgi:hypothetical protein